MLEKSKGVILVSKLRAILLLESDFNGLNKIIFNRRVILKLEEKRVIPCKIIEGRRGKLLQHIALNKKLVCNISNYSKKTVVVILADASNC